MNLRQAVLVRAVNSRGSTEIVRIAIALTRYKLERPFRDLERNDQEQTKYLLQFVKSALFQLNYTSMSNFASQRIHRAFFQILFNIAEDYDNFCGIKIPNVIFRL